MHVIGHHNEHVQFDARESRGQPAPFIQNHPTGVRETHLAIHDLAEPRHPILGANRDEVRAGLRVVVALQADRPAMINRSRNDGVFQWLAILSKSFGRTPIFM